MKKNLFFFLLTIICWPAQAQDVKIIQIAELQSMLNKGTDTTLVLNFWASWCTPCLKELPEFEQVGRAYVDQKVKIVFINLDNLDKLDTKVKPILKRNQIQSETLLLNESDANTWIDKVDPNWQGSLPYTTILNNNKELRVKIESAITREELEIKLQPFLK